MTNKSKIIITESEEETLKVGRKIGENLAIPCTILLEGRLGSGKTALTRGIVWGFSGQDPSETNVHSPTFSLVNQYETQNGTIYHIDLYRLDSLSDQYSIGLEEILYEEALIIIEWSEKLLIQAEPDLLIRLQSEMGDQRKITISDQGT